MSLPEYIGHLHPVLVHLPIGILLTAILFQWLSTRKGFRKLRKSVGPLLFLGFVSAAFAAFTGYMLAQSGDYDASLLKTHQWLGITVAVLSAIVLLIRKRKDKEAKAAYSLLMVALAILILLTGHFGGSLTHGSDFLSPGAVTSWFGGEESSPLPADLKSAFLYKDLVEPIFKTRCIRCHGPSRQKGKLRLDQPEFILKGGKDGHVIQTATLEESELFKRIHLPPDDEDHMPPREKGQLDKTEIAILSFWIATGSDFKGKLGALPRADSLIAWIKDPGASEPDPAEEVEVVPLPNPAIVETLRKGGVTVSFLSEGNGALSLNFMNADTALFSSLLSQLPLLQPQLLHLKLERCRLSPGDWSQLAKLTSLTRLYLGGSNVADINLVAFHLPKLEYLNLVGTSISTAGLDPLKSLHNLKRLFLFNTQVKASDEEAIRKALPKVAVDFGNYQVPTLASDTVILKKPFVAR